MSALAACLHPDGGAVPDSTVALLSAALASRGELHWWREGPVALAGTAPPLVGQAAVVVCDGRIDNGDDLARQWGIDADAPTAAAIVAEAYRRHGADGAASLIGEFAFAIWDREAQSMFCGRDHFGVRPFFYSQTEKCFAAASNVAALTALPGVGDAPSETGIADFLAGIIVDPAATMYDGVHRLPPAHVMMVAQGADPVPRAYWCLDSVAPAAGEGAAERFRGMFEDAVRCRVAAGGAPGVLLSGGLDSSSIAAVAARDRRAAGLADLPSLSMTFEAQPNWNEGPFIDAVIAQGGLDPIIVANDEEELTAALSALLDEQGEPVLAYNAGISRRLYHAAARAGVDVLLDGHGGDEVVSHGYGRLNELAQARRWRTLWREARGIAAIHGDPIWDVVAPYTLHHPLVRAGWAAWCRIAKPAPSDGDDDLVAPALAERVGLADRRAAAERPRFARDTERDLQLASLNQLGGGNAFDVLGNMAAAAGVTPAYPFYDRRLVEYCVALPSEAKLRDGWPRRVLRDAMVGILPESVRLRRDKFDFAGQLAEKLVAAVPAIRAMIDDGGVLARFVNGPAARAMLDRLASRGSAAVIGDVFGAWRMLVLGLWLARLPEGAA